MSNQEIRIEKRNVEAFAKELPGAKDKTVLYLKGNVLNAKPLLDTTLYERVLAWFGLGPLSLKNISKFIYDHDVLKTIPELSTKLLTSCEHYNRSHSVQKISRVCIDQLSQNCRLEFADVSSTHVDIIQKKTIPQDMILDFAYSNAKLGTAYVIDVAGENSSDAKKIWDGEIKSFRDNYETSLKKQQFSSIPKASVWFKSQMNDLLKLRTDDDSNFDLYWVQKVEIDGKLFLLSCQEGTVTAFIKHSDGKIDRTVAPEALTFSEKPISRSDIIVGISDGFGDFITHSEMALELQKVDQGNKQLYQNLILKLYSRIDSMDPAVESASGKLTTKSLTKDTNINRGDNIAIFVLR